MNDLFLQKLKKIRLIIADLDGTLLNENSKLSIKTINTVERLRKQGIEFTIATGRLDYMAKLFACQLNLNLPIISCNGGIISFPQHHPKKVIKESILNFSEAYLLTKYYLENDFDFLIYTNTGIYCRQNSQRMSVHKYYAKMLKMHCNDVFNKYFIEKELLNDFYQKQYDENFKIVKFYVQTPREKLDEAIKFTKYNTSFETAISWHGSFDVMAEGISKAEGIKMICRQYGYDIKEVACFGDHGNDIEMLQAAGLSFAMGNATEDVKNISDMICKSNKLDGVAMTIQQLFIK